MNERTKYHYDIHILHAFLYVCVCARNDVASVECFLQNHLAKSTRDSEIVSAFEYMILFLFAIENEDAICSFYLVSFFLLSIVEIIFVCLSF